METNAQRRNFECIRRNSTTRPFYAEHTEKEMQKSLLIGNIWNAPMWTGGQAVTVCHFVSQPAALLITAIEK